MHCKQNRSYKVCLTGKLFFIRFFGNIEISSYTYMCMYTNILSSEWFIIMFTLCRCLVSVSHAALWLYLLCLKLSISSFIYVNCVELLRVERRCIARRVICDAGRTRLRYTTRVEIVFIFRLRVIYLVS